MNESGVRERKGITYNQEPWLRCILDTKTKNLLKKALEAETWPKTLPDDFKPYYPLEHFFSAYACTIIENDVPDELVQNPLLDLDSVPSKILNEGIEESKKPILNYCNEIRSTNVKLYDALTKRMKAIVTHQPKTLKDAILVSFATRDSKLPEGFPWPVEDRLQAQWLQQGILLLIRAINDYCPDLTSSQALRFLATAVFIRSDEEHLVESPPAYMKQITADLSVEALKAKVKSIDESLAPTMPWDAYDIAAHIKKRYATRDSVLHDIGGEKVRAMLTKIEQEYQLVRSIFQKQESALLENKERHTRHYIMIGQAQMMAEIIAQAP